MSSAGERRKAAVLAAQQRMRKQLNVDEPLTVDQQLARLENDIRRLKVEFDIYFSGATKHPPYDTRNRIETVISRLGDDRTLTFAQRYKYNSLVGRFSSFRELWRRTIQNREEGRDAATNVKNHLLQKRAKEAEESGASATTTLTAPASQVSGGPSGSVPHRIEPTVVAHVAEITAPQTGAPDSFEAEWSQNRVTPPAVSQLTNSGPVRSELDATASGTEPTQPRGKLAPPMVVMQKSRNQGLPFSTKSAPSSSHTKPETPPVHVPESVAIEPVAPVAPVEIGDLRQTPSLVVTQVESKDQPPAAESPIVTIVQPPPAAVIPVVAEQLPAAPAAVIPVVVEQLPAAPAAVIPVVVEQLPAAPAAVIPIVTIVQPPPAAVIPVVAEQLPAAPAAVIPIVTIVQPPPAAVIPIVVEQPPAPQPAAPAAIVQPSGPTLDQSADPIRSQPVTTIDRAQLLSIAHAFVSRDAKRLPDQAIEPGSVSAPASDSTAGLDSSLPGRAEHDAIAPAAREADLQTTGPALDAGNLQQPRVPMKARAKYTNTPVAAPSDHDGEATFYVKGQEGLVPFDSGIGAFEGNATAGADEEFPDAMELFSMLEEALGPAFDELEIGGATHTPTTEPAAIEPEAAPTATADAAPNSPVEVSVAAPERAPVTKPLVVLAVAPTPTDPEVIVPESLPETSAPIFEIRDPRKQSADVKALYNALAQARLDCGEAADEMPLSRFQHLLAARADKVKKSHRCKSVRFTIEVEGEHVNLKAMPGVKN